MRVGKAFICLSIRTGLYISIIFDVIKTLLGLFLLILVYTNIDLQYVDKFGNEESLEKQDANATDQDDSKAEKNMAMIFSFASNFMIYMATAIIGLIVLFGKFENLTNVGSYFWVKLITSFLTLYSTLPTMTVVNKPQFELFITVGYFCIDMYLIIIIYSFWRQKKKEKEEKEKEQEVFMRRRNVQQNRRSIELVDIEINLGPEPAVSNEQSNDQNQRKSSLDQRPRGGSLDERNERHEECKISF